MKLYYSPGACSLASYIALTEAGADFESEAVDLRTKITESGADFTAITVKGYVPALVLEDNQLLSENIAVLDYLAAQYPQLGLDGPLGRTRLIEALAYVSTEIHKSFKPFWHHGSDADKAVASAYITKRFGYLADRLKGDFLFGDRPSVADFYLFVTMEWAERFSVTIPDALQATHARLKARPSVHAALSAEGLA